MTLFTKCLQATVPHLLAADVLLRVPGTLHPLDPYNWSSPFVARLNASTASFLAYLTGTSTTSFDLSSPQWFLAHTPVASGGLGLHDYAARAVASFIVPLARSIHFATHGFLDHCSDTIIPTPPPLAWGLLEWESSASLLFAVFHLLGPPLLANERYRNVDNVLSHLHLLLISAPLSGTWSGNINVPNCNSFNNK